MKERRWRYKTNIFVYYRIRYTIRERTVYGEERFGVTKRRQFYRKLTVESLEDTMPEMPRQGRYGEAGYGGLQH